MLGIHCLTCMTRWEHFNHRVACSYPFRTLSDPHPFAAKTEPAAAAKKPAVGYPLIPPVLAAAKCVLWAWELGLNADGLERTLQDESQLVAQVSQGGPSPSISPSLSSLPHAPAAPPAVLQSQPRQQPRQAAPLSSSQHSASTRPLQTTWSRLPRRARPLVRDLKGLASKSEPDLSCCCLPMRQVPCSPRRRKVPRSCQECRCSRSPNFCRR